MSLSTMPKPAFRPDLILPDPQKQKARERCCYLVYKGGPCQRDRILDRISDPIFGSYPATLFFPAYKLANVSHTLVSKVETIAVCERERVAHVCCAALAQCMPVHAHCGAHACSVLQEENRSARFAKAATSRYLVDVSPTHSFARCVGLVGRLGLGRAHVRMDSSRLRSSSKPTSDPARSPICVRLSV